METKYKIVKTPDYILAVSDEEIKVGDWCFLDNNIGMSTGYQVLQCLQANVEDGEYDFEDNGESFYTGRCKKIIAYQPKGNVPKLNLPLLPEIVVEDDVEKLLNDDFTVCNSLFNISKTLFSLVWRFGYKSANKLYTEEDLRKAIELSRITYKEKTFGTVLSKYKPGEIVNLVTQHKSPKWFVAEAEQVILKDPNTCGNYTEVGCVKDICKCYTFEPKTYEKDGNIYMKGEYLFD
jgi:hypothetical protein